MARTSKRGAVAADGTAAGDGAGPLAGYFRLMDTLVAQFGANCQTSLYAARGDEARLVGVSGKVMEMSIGSRLPQALLERLAPTGVGGHGRLLFTSSTPDGRRLSSSLTALEDAATGERIGFLRIDLCIEHLISSIDALQTFCGIDEPPPAEAPAEEDVGQLVEAIIADTFDQRKGTRSTSGKEYRVEIVRRLEERGVFRVKGAVEIVSASLNVSKYSIYNYIDQVRKARSVP